MHRRTLVTRAVASAAAVAFLASPASAVAAPDPASDGGPAPRPGSVVGQALPGAVRPADKITPAAKKAFAARGTTSFWLRFADTADLGLDGGVTSWSERGEHVYETLVATAEAAQKEAVAELEESGTEYTSYWATNAILVKGGSLDLATDLAADAEVLEIRPTTRYEAPEPVDAAVVPDEGVSPSAVTPAWGISAINADALWDAGHTGDGIVVANIDTGVDGDHGALSGTYRGQGSSSLDAYSYFSVDGRYYPHDEDGHGTHTMGTMVGGTVRYNGADRAVGVAPGARWIAAAGGGDGWTDEDLIASGQWILAPYRQGWTDPAPDPAMRPHVVNNSWGADFSTDPFMEDVITAWEASGIFATFANGNMGEYGCESSGTPGSRTVNYSVGAFSTDGRIAPFSSRGPGQSGSVKPDIAAPGGGVLSTVPGGSAALKSGTSMAAPHVAGSVALLWSAVPELVGNVPATRAILDGSARDQNDTSCGGTSDDNNVWGEGRLDVLAAYELAEAQAFDAAPAPVISGAETKVGVPLSVSVPAWSPVASFAYQWRRDGQSIPGATRTTYTPRGADAGAELSVTVVGSADGRTPTAVTSEPTSAVAPGVMATSAPTISPTAKVGTTLYARSGSWTSGTTFTYRWAADGTAISGATSFTFVPTSVHRGKRLTVTITGKRPGYVSTSRTSAAVTVGYGTFSMPTPRISGMSAVGVTVTAVAPPSTPARTSTTYQWKVDGKVITSARTSKFKIPASFDGRRLTVTVTGKRPGITTRSVTSAHSTVADRFSAFPNPTVSGSARVGSRLTVRTGTWRPTPTFTYQWHADTVPIPGATSSSYTLKGQQLGKKISVVVTARKAGYATAVRSGGSDTAVRRPLSSIPADGGYLVGSGSVPAGTYVAAAGTRYCAWQRASRTQVLGADYGYGQRIATARSTDYGFWSDSCGPWTKHYSGMVTPKSRTYPDGVYVLGDQLQRGTYVTTGPAVENSGPCYYAFIDEFLGTTDGSHLVSSGSVTDARTITMPSSAAGFETSNCVWQRVS